MPPRKHSPALMAAKSSQEQIETFLREPDSMALLYLIADNDNMGFIQIMALALLGQITIAAVERKEGDANSTKNPCVPPGS